MTPTPRLTVPRIVGAVCLIAALGVHLWAFVPIAFGILLFPEINAWYLARVPEPVRSLVHMYAGREFVAAVIAYGYALSGHAYLVIVGIILLVPFYDLWRRAQDVRPKAKPLWLPAPNKTGDHILELPDRRPELVERRLKD